MFGWFRRRKLRKDLEQAFADGRIDDSEANQLKARTAELGLEQADLHDAVADRFAAETASIKQRIEETRRFSPDDEARMLDLAKRCGVGKLTFDDAHWRCRQLWAAEHGEPLSPRPVEASFVLKRGEACYLTASSTWKQIKTVKHRVGAHGHAASIRIMKGWSYRISSVKPVYDSEEILATLLEGTFAITNKRIVFEGDRRSTSINFGSIVDYELYSDAIEIRKSRGPNEFFALSRADAEYVAVLITHFMSA